jgi:hypothetical protein
LLWPSCFAAAGCARGRDIGGPASMIKVHLRMPLLLVLGSNGEVAEDYAGELVRFFPGPVAGDEMLALAVEMLALNGSKASYARFSVGAQDKVRLS